MDSTIARYIKQLRADVESDIHKIVRDAAKMAREDFTKEAKACLDNYYKEYSPEFYSRNYELRNNSCRPYTLWNNNTMQAGARFTDREMDTSVYNRDIAPKDGWASGIGGIIINDFMEGMHGSELTSRKQGEQVAKRMEKYEKEYATKMDAYFIECGLTRIK